MKLTESKIKDKLDVEELLQQLTKFHNKSELLMFKVGSKGVSYNIINDLPIESIEGILPHYRQQFKVWLSQTNGIEYIKLGNEQITLYTHIYVYISLRWWLLTQYKETQLRKVFKDIHNGEDITIEEFLNNKGVNEYVVNHIRNKVNQRLGGMFRKNVDNLGYFLLQSKMMNHKPQLTKDKIKFNNKSQTLSRCKRSIDSLLEDSIYVCFTEEGIDNTLDKIQSTTIEYKQNEFTSTETISLLECLFDILYSVNLKVGMWERILGFDTPLPKYKTQTIKNTSHTPIQLYKEIKSRLTKDVV